MNYLIYLGITISYILFSSIIQPRIEIKWPDTKLPINLMGIAVASALALAGIIEIISDGVLPVSSYFIILSILVGILLCYGITNRTKVSQRMRKSYYSNLVGLSYSLLATGFLMFWFAPLFPNVIL